MLNKIDDDKIISKTMCEKCKRHLDIFDRYELICVGLRFFISNRKKRHRKVIFFLEFQNSSKNIELNN